MCPGTLIDVRSRRSSATINSVSDRQNNIDREEATTVTHNAPRMTVPEPERTKKNDSAEPEIAFAVAEPLASTFVAKVFKESKDKKCGIRLRQALPTDPVTISRLGADGLFADTDLRIGMEVASVNGVDIDGMTRIKAIQLVKDAEGDLTVVGKAVAGGAVAVVFKESKDQKCGIILRQGGPSDPVTVSGIGEDGLFAQTDLKVGMQVMSINNVAVEDMTKEQAIQIVKDTEGKLTVVGQPYVAKPSSIPASYAPPGIADGGIWGKNKYIGNQTQMLAFFGCLCCGLPGLCVCLCPQDDRDVYRLGNKLYDAGGTFVGTFPSEKFIPSQRMNAPGNAPMGR